MLIRQPQKPFESIQKSKSFQKIPKSTFNTQNSIEKLHQKHLKILDMNKLALKARENTVNLIIVCARNVEFIFSLSFRKKIIYYCESRKRFFSVISKKKKLSDKCIELINLRGIQKWIVVKSEVINGSERFH